MKRAITAQLALHGPGRDESPLNKLPSFQSFSFTVEGVTDYAGEIIHRERWRRSSIDNRLDAWSMDLR